jgi:molecular chaperone GrpE
MSDTLSEVENQTAAEATLEAEASDESQSKPSDDTNAPTEADNDTPISLELLQKQLREAQAEADKYKDQMLRQHAELDNVRKRLRRDVEDAHKFALKNIAIELLPILDSMELEQKSAQENQETNVETLREGSALILKMLTNCFEKFNIEVIDPTEQKFDPELHEAIAMVPVPDAEPNTIVQVQQKGYQLNQRLLRPAMVIVAAKS